jgi:hypothetical protein
MSVCVYFVLSCEGSGLATGLITRPMGRLNRYSLTCFAADLQGDYLHSARAITTTKNDPPMCQFNPVIIVVVIISGVRLSELCTAATTDLLYLPQVINDDDYEAVDGMKIGRGNRNTRRNPAPVPLVHHNSHTT